MVERVWSASSAGSASTASNWSGGVAPTSSDTVVFNNTSVVNCTWDITAVSTITVASTYTGLITVNTDIDLNGLSCSRVGAFSASANRLFDFSGTSPYNSNKTFFQIGIPKDTSIFANETARRLFTFTYSGSTTGIKYEAGEYPNIVLASGSHTPDYIQPSLSANTATAVKFYSLNLKSGSFAPSSLTPTTADRDKEWISQGTTQNQFKIDSGIGSFDGGYATWTFQGIGGGFILPTNGSTTYNGCRFKWQKWIIDSSIAGAGSLGKIANGSSVFLNDLTINAGAAISGDNQVGGTFYLTNKPTIRGTWGFYPIADGIYVYKGLHTLTVADGGTGLQSVTNGRIPFGSTSASLNTNQDLTFENNTLHASKGIKITEGADHPINPATGTGIIWVKDTTPSTLIFTDDAGTDTTLGSGSGGSSGTVTSVAVSGSDGIQVDSGSPITTSGTIALGVDKNTLLSHINVDDGADVTNATTVNAAGAIMHSDLGTKGDLVVGDGVGDATILGVGTNTHVLTADSSEPSGVKWAAASGGGGAVDSVFGRTGVVVATEGDYDLDELGDVTITTPTDLQVLVYEGSEWVNGWPEVKMIQVRNDEGSTIAAGSPLYSKGEIGGSNRIKVGIADANNSSKMPCIGIAYEDMNTSSTKDNYGVVSGIYNTNISGFTGLSVGDTLYVSSGGGLTDTKPTGITNLIQNVGIVLKTNTTICQGLLVSAIGRTNDVPNQFSITGSITAGSFIKTGGGSPSEFLKSDGSVDTTAYGTVTSVATTAPITGGTITSTGTVGFDISGLTANTAIADADLLLLDDGANGTNRKITFTEVKEWIRGEGIAVGVNGGVNQLKIRDSRDDGELTPDDWNNKQVSFDFTDDIAGSTNAWDGVMTMKGWSDSYRVFQLLSSASSEGSSGKDTEPLYFRSGEDTGWGALRQVLTFPGTTPNADGSSGQVLQTNGSGALSWATVSGGGGAKQTCMVRLANSIPGFPQNVYTLVNAPGNWTAPACPDFDENTGLYTAPIAGVYRISWSIACRYTPPGQSQHSRIYVNGNPAAQGTGNSTGNWPVFGGSILLDLQAGDTVGLYVFVSQAGTTLVGDSLTVGAVQMSINEVG